MASCPLVCYLAMLGQAWLLPEFHAFLAVSDGPLVILVISEVSSPNQYHGIPRII